MTRQRVALDLDAAGRGAVTIDGFPIAGASGVCVDARAGSLPRVTVEVHPSALTVLADGEVGVSEEVAATLRALGWTPPDAAGPVQHGSIDALVASTADAAGAALPPLPDSAYPPGATPLPVERP